MNEELMEKCVGALKDYIISSWGDGESGYYASFGDACDLLIAFALHHGIELDYEKLRAEWRREALDYG